jgi:hypothetical protein
MDSQTQLSVLSQRQKESGEFEESLHFSLNLENLSGSPISITQAEPESGEWEWEDLRSSEMA